MSIRIPRWLLTILPIIYVALVWLQSRFFNPSVFAHRPFIGTWLEHGHFVLFAILYALILLALASYGRITLRKECIAALIAMCCALADEWHQHYVPFRSSTLDDMFKNLTGIIVIALFIHVWRKIK